MVDLSQLSDEELMSIAGGAASSGGSSGLSDLSSIPDEELYKLAGVNTQTPTSPERVAVGGLSKILGGLTLGAGDEIVAGGNAALDMLGGQGFGDAYDQRLNDVRSMQKEFGEQAGGFSSGVVDIGSSLLMPVGKIGQAIGLTKATPAAITTAERVKEAAKLGAGIGGAAGFLNSEGGLENRAEGALGGAAIGAPLGAVGEYGATKLQSGLDTASDQFRAWALSVTRGDVAKSRKFGGGTATESPLTQAINAVDERGLFKGSKDPVAVLERNRQAIRTESNSINDILKKADDVRAAQGELVAPEMNNARKFLQEASPGDKAALKSQYERTVNEIADDWDGSIQGLQALKKRLYKKSYKGNTDSADLNKAIAEDLREAVETGVSKFSSAENAATVIATNKRIGQHLTVRPIFEKARDQSESGNAGVAQLARSLFSSPLSGTAAGIGYGLYEGKDLKGALGYGLTGGLATSRGGQWLLSSLFRKSADKLGPQAGNAITKMFAPSAGKKEELKREEVMKQVDKSPALPLVDAVIAQESGGKSDAVSNVGAVGLMQIMPETAKEIAKEIGLKDYNLKDPETNKLMGTYYLEKLLQQFDGDEELALTAYHSGPGRVKKLLEKNRGTQLADIIDDLGPVGQKYARQVLARLA